MTFGKVLQFRSKTEQIELKALQKQFGSLRTHVEAGKLSETTLYAELGPIVAGLKPGRQSHAETNPLWHRGLSLSDIALGHAMLEESMRLGIDQQLRFAWSYTMGL